MRFPEDQEWSKTLETSPPFLTFGSLTVPYFLSYSLIILSKARFIKSLIAIPSLAAIVLIFVTLSSSAIVQNLITLLYKAGRPLFVRFSSAAESSFTGACFFFSVGSDDCTFENSFSSPFSTEKIHKK